jgi:hypothetical protein
MKQIISSIILTKNIPISITANARSNKQSRHNGQQNIHSVIDVKIHFKSNNKPIQFTLSNIFLFFSEQIITCASQPAVASAIRGVGCNRMNSDYPIKQTEKLNSEKSEKHAVVIKANKDK